MTQASAYPADLIMAALQGADIGVWHLRAGANCLEWDGIAETILGRASPSSIRGLLHSVAPEDRAAAIGFFRSAQHSTGQSAIEFRILQPSGTSRWLQCLGCAPKEPNGTYRLAGIVRDITGQREAVLRLQESQRQLSTLVNNLPGVAFRCDAASPWRIRYISEGVAELTGYTASMFQSGQLLWNEIIHPDDWPATARDVVVAVTEHRPFRLEYRILHATGDIRWVQDRGEAVYDAQGQPASLEGFISDVTDQVRSEAELQRSKKLFEAILEGIPDGIFLKDYTNNARYVFVNSAAERLAGMPASDIIGRSDADLFPPDEVAIYAEQDRQVAENEVPSTLKEWIVEGPQGERILEVRKTSIRDAPEKHCYVLGIIRERTAQRALEHQLQKMQRMDAIGKLTGGIAHDFNNLLAIIMGYSELLRDSTEDPELTATANQIVNATERGAELVRRLLAFARKQRLEPRVVNLNERLPDILALLRGTLGENIHIEMIAGKDLWPAFVDPSQVDDVLVNLAINARDAMPGGGSLTVETANVELDPKSMDLLSDGERGDYVMLAVSDTGQGMSPDVMAQAFEPFFTTKEPGKGTGLGLSMVYGFVKQSGGQLSIDSSPGQGTTVRLYLPRATTEADTREDRAAPSQVAGGDESILLVEDNEDIREMVALHLRKLGYRVTEAGTAAEALSVLDQNSEFDLLMTDIVMPGGMSGHELAEKVRRDWPDIKILFSTGTEMPVAERNLDKSLKADVLRKPFRLYELARAVRTALNRETGAA